MKSVETQACDIILVHRRWRGYRNEVGHWGSYFLSWRIQKATRSKWNHAALMLDDDILIEAVKVIRAIPLSYYSDDKDKYEIKVLRYPELSETQKEDIAKWAKFRLNEKYDWTAIIRMRLALYVGGLIGAKFMLDNINDNQWICSEFIQEAYRQAGIGFQAGLMTPADFDRLPCFEVIYDSSQIKPVETSQVSFVEKPPL